MVTRPLAAAGFLTAWLVAAPATAQPRDAVRTDAAAATITGVVLSVERPARPLRRARVLLIGSEMATGRTVVTNDDGTFAFGRLPADEYVVSAAKDGFITMRWGAASPGRRGRPIALRRGEARRITVRLPRGSVITGRIADAQGQPMAGVQVEVLANRFEPSIGERRLTKARPPTTTDDRGVYRLFDLPAGDYLVAAHAFPALSRESDLQVLSEREVRRALAELRDTRMPAAPGFPVPVSYKPLNEPRQSVGFAPVFYPGTVVLSQAVTVTVGAGQQRTGVDFDVQYVPTATVSGAVVAPAGGVPPVVALIPDTEVVDPDWVRVRTVGPEGAFEFTGVPPGRYSLFARGAGSPSSRSAGVSTWGATEIVVDGHDVTDLSLPLQAGLTIAGHVQFTGTARPRSARGRFELPIALTMRGPLDRALTVQVEADAGFSVEGVVPGSYRLEQVQGLRSPLGGLWLKSIVMNDLEILDAPIDLRHGTDDAVVTWSSQASEVAGVVTDSRGAALPGQTVILFATDRRFWFFNSRRIATGRTDVQGRYRIRNLPPGDYHVIATDAMDDGEWFDPVALEQAARSAASLSVEQDERKTLNLTRR